MKNVLTVLLLFLLPFGAVAVQDPCIPSKPKDQDQLLFQYTPLLSPQDAERLNTKLVRFAQETSNQLAVVIVDTLCGYPPSDFAFQLGQDWGIGRSEHDNGIVVLIKPTGGPGQRQVFIATGYGMEGAIPDLTAKRIVDNEILPAFREGAFYAGLNSATDTLMGLAKGEISVESYGQPVFPWGAVVLIVAAVGFYLMMQVGRVKRYARRNDLDFWAAWTLLNAASARHGGSWGGFTGGGGHSGGGHSGGGGFGGGGFGGFGGGGFGGGGAGGSW